MDTDLVLTLGVVLIVLSVPSLLSAWTDGRAPRVGGIMLITAIALLAAAMTTRPGGYRFEDMPGVVMGVISRYVIR